MRSDRTSPHKSACARDARMHVSSFMRIVGSSCFTTRCVSRSSMTSRLGISATRDRSSAIGVGMSCHGACDTLDRHMEAPGRRCATHSGGLIAWLRYTTRRMQAIVEEIRSAIRSLVKSPGFTLVGLVTLAVGIGANTAIFSVVNAVILRPLSVEDSESVVRFLTTTGASTAVAGVQQYEAWRGQHVFEDVSAHRLEYVNLTGQARPEQIPIARVTREFFQLFRAPLLAGRTFTAVEDRPGWPHVAILSHELWTRRFQSDPAIIGRTISLGNAPHDVVGVLAPGFDTEQFDTEPGVWVPFQIDPQRVDGGNLFTVTGR